MIMFVRFLLGSEVRGISALVEMQSTPDNCKRF